MPTLAQAREAIRKKEARGDIAGASAIRRALEERGLSTVTDSELEAQRAEQRERLLEQQLQDQLEYAESQRGSIARGIDIGTDIIGQATGSALEGIGGLLLSLIHI